MFNFVKISYSLLLLLLLLLPQLKINWLININMVFLSSSSQLPCHHSLSYIPLLSNDHTTSIVSVDEIKHFCMSLCAIFIIFVRSNVKISYRQLRLFLWLNSFSAPSHPASSAHPHFLLFPHTSTRSSSYWYAFPGLPKPVSRNSLTTAPVPCREILSDRTNCFKIDCPPDKPYWDRMSFLKYFVRPLNHAVRFGRNLGVFFGLKPEIGFSNLY